MVTKLQLEIDSTVHKFLKEHAKQDGLSIEDLIIRLIERYKRDADAPGVHTRQVWENAQDAQDFEGTVSPDGRYLTYVNWDNGNLAIHDFETGEDRDVTIDERKHVGDWHFAGAAIWSPDSKQIAYSWFKGSGKREDRHLRIVGINGSKPRVLWNSPTEPEFLSPRAWSRDGKHILALHHKRTDKTHVHIFVLVSVGDGSMRVLKSLDGRRLGNFGHWMSLSPDGRYVVYDSPQSEGSSNCDIFLLATDESREVTLVEHPANDFAPVWAPDGNRIVFASDRSGSMGIWVLDVVDGESEGFPRLISDNLNGMSPLGLTQNSSYYYGLQGRANDIYFANLDPDTGKAVKPPIKAIQNFEGLNSLPDFSPDGKRLVYLSRQGTGGWRHFSSFIIRCLKTGEEYKLQPDLPLVLMVCSAPRWSPDGLSILVLAAYTNSTRKLWQMCPGLHQINVETGATTHVVWNDEQGDILRLTLPVWSPDGSKIFFMRKRGKSASIRAYDFEAEREWSPDFRSKHGNNYFKHDLAISPDGQKLAFVGCFKDRHSLEIAPAAGGDTREVVRLPKEGFPNGMRLVWTPDGRHLLFTWLKDEATELWRISVEGGEPENLGLTMEKIESLSIHPDGDRVAFTGPGSGRCSEVWVIENILPTATK